MAQATPKANTGEQLNELLASPYPEETTEKRGGTNPLSSYKLKKTMEKRTNFEVKRDLYRVATDFVFIFYKEIKPVFLLCGITEDESISNFLKAETLEEVYKEGERKDKKRMQLLAEFAETRKEDFWAPFRAANSPVKKPTEKGFLFKEMPYYFEWNRPKWIKAVKVKDGNPYVDETVIDSESEVSPSPEAEKIYKLATDFCNKLAEMGKAGLSARTLFLIDTNGHLCPNDNGIFWGV